GDSHGQAAPLQDRYVRQVVPHETDCLGSQSSLTQQVAKRLPFVRRALNYGGDAQLLGPDLHHARRAAREYCCSLACELPERKRRAVANVILLQLTTVVGVYDSPVRQHAVHVQEQQPNSSATFAQCHAAVTPASTLRGSSFGFRCLQR